MPEIRYLEARSQHGRITCLDDGTDGCVTDLLEECRRAGWEPGFTVHRMISDTRGDTRHADGKDKFRGHRQLKHWRIE